MTGSILGKQLFIGKGVDLTSIDAEKDAATFSKWAEQPQFNRRFNFGMFRLIPEHEMKKKLAENLKKAEEKRNAFLFAVRKHDGGDLIGFARIIWILHAHQVGTLFIDFGEETDLIKHGAETLQMMLRYGFMEANLNRLDVTLPAYETEMIALYESKGFLREVQRREAAFHANRRWDELVYALLKPDFKKNNEEEQK